MRKWGLYFVIAGLVFTIAVLYQHYYSSIKKGKETASLPLNQVAAFSGGHEKFISFFVDEFKTPSQLLETDSVGYALLRFVVNIDGSVSDIEIIESSNDLFTQEAVRVLKKSPKWKPGYRNGHAIKSYREVPIRLHLID